MRSEELWNVGNKLGGREAGDAAERRVMMSFLQTAMVLGVPVVAW